MSATEICHDTQLLISYVYGECDAAERRRLEAHLASCASCAAEVSELRATRQHMSEWSAPEVEPGIGGLRPVVVRVPPRRWSAMPGWGLAAAAVLVLAAAAAVSNLEIRVSRNGVSIRTGWGSAPSTAGAGLSGASPAAPGTAPVTMEALREIERRLRAEMQPARTHSTSPSPAIPDRNDEALVARVRSLIEQSERRQQRELALRLTQLVQDFDRQRQADLMRIQHGMGQLETFTGAEAARQRELMNYVVRISQQQK